jgi:hypothetical protein
VKGKNVDKYYPIIVGAIPAFAYLVLFAFFPKVGLLKGFRDLFVSSVTINCLSVGFLATAKATLISIHNSRIVKWLKDAGAFESTVNYFMDATHLSVVSAIWSSLLLLIDFNDPVKYISAGIAIWIYLATAAMLSMYRIIRLFTKILLKA